MELGSILGGGISGRHGPPPALTRFDLTAILEIGMNETLHYPSGLVAWRLESIHML